jgi:glycosyltransferase involved in cell wall biosynthesis
MGDDSMKNLAVNLSFLSVNPSGISNYAANLLPHLSELSPYALSTLPVPNYSHHCTPVGMSTDFGSKGHLKRLWWTQTQLPRIYRQLQTDLLFSPLPEAPLSSGCRYVVTVHDLIPLRFGGRLSRLGNYFRFLVPHVLDQAQHILCNSQSTASELIDYFGIAAAKITPTLLAYDANHFQWLNLATKNYFLYLGRHDRHKNLVRLIQAFASLPISADYQLWLAGASDRRYTPALLAVVKELGLESRVRFLNYIPYAELPRLINQAIALVFPSLWEGFGLPALEAMACGTPVITSNLSALPEVTGEAAILIDPYELKEIATAMAEMVRDSQLRSHLQRMGIERAKRFSWQQTGKQTVGVLRQFL